MVWLSCRTPSPRPTDLLHGMCHHHHDSNPPMEYGHRYEQSQLNQTHQSFDEPPTVSWQRNGLEPGCLAAHESLHREFYIHHYAGKQAKEGKGSRCSLFPLLVTSSGVYSVGNERGDVDSSDKTLTTYSRPSLHGGHLVEIEFMQPIRIDPPQLEPEVSKGRSLYFLYHSDPLLRPHSFLSS